MSKVKESLSVILKRLCHALESMSEEELSKLADPQYLVEVKAVRRRTKDEPSLLPPDFSAEEAIAKVTVLPTRIEAQAFLDTQFSSKKELERIARTLDIPINRKDKAEDLRHKIVEATVGARLRSQAIQGTGA